MVTKSNPAEDGVGVGGDTREGHPGKRPQSGETEADRKARRRQKRKKWRKNMRETKRPER